MDSVALVFTDIQFSGKDSVRMSLASANLTLQCQRKGEVAAPLSMPTEGNSISHEGVVYPLTHAIEVAFNRNPSPGDSHIGARYKFADSQFSILPLPVGGGVINAWVPAGETVQPKAQLYHPGIQPFSSAEFRHMPDSVDDEDREVAGVAFFNDAFLAVDLNRDGAVEGDDGELIDVTGGSITITKLDNGNSRVSMNLELANGTTATGFYEGLILMRSTSGV